MCALQNPGGDAHEEGNKEIQCGVLLKIILSEVAIAERQEASEGFRSWRGSTLEDNERGRGQILV